MSKGKIILDGQYLIVSERIKENVDLIFPCLYTDLSGGDRTICHDGIFRCPGYYYNIEIVSKEIYDKYNPNEDVFSDDNYGKIIQLKPEVPEEIDVTFKDDVAIVAMSIYLDRLPIDTKPDIIADKSYLLSEAILRRRLR